MYGIARYFKADERRRALNLYEWAREHQPDLCPLGALLRVHAQVPTVRPTDAQVASQLFPSWQLGRWLEAERLAGRFTVDYDDGKIVDVARALGVKGRESR